MVECVVDVPGMSESACDLTAQGIADAVKMICDSYGRACRRFTGLDLRKMEIADRRGSGRDVVVLPFYLSPIFQNGTAFSRGADAPMLAVTRDLSERGVGFRCDIPIPTTQLIAEFDSLKIGLIRLLLEVRWRRRQSMHCYLAGARIIRVLESHEFL